MSKYQIYDVVTGKVYNSLNNSMRHVKNVYINGSDYTFTFTEKPKPKEIQKPIQNHYGVNYNSKLECLSCGGNQLSPRGTYSSCGSSNWKTSRTIDIEGTEMAKKKKKEKAPAATNEELAEDKPIEKDEAVIRLKEWVKKYGNLEVEHKDTILEPGWFRKTGRYLVHIPLSIASILFALLVGVKHPEYTGTAGGMLAISTFMILNSCGAVAITKLLSTVFKNRFWKKAKSQKKIQINLVGGILQLAEAEGKKKKGYHQTTLREFSQLTAMPSFDLQKLVEQMDAQELEVKLKEHKEGEAEQLFLARMEMNNLGEKEWRN